MYGLDLFSGIGGLSIAVAPWVKTVAYCEREPKCQEYLLSRMADGQLDCGPIWDDVRTLKWEGPALDLITAGFPCQDISIAGTRNGRKGLDGARSGLFWEVVRLTEEIRPQFVFLENVGEAVKHESTIRRAFEHLGYLFKSTTNTVYSVGGFHERKRWFALAYLEGSRVERLRPEGKQESQSLDITLLPLCTSDGQWEVEPDIRRTTDGIPGWVDRIKALGNAVVPLQARKAFEALALPGRDAPLPLPLHKRTLSNGR